MKKTIASAMFATILNLFGCNAQTEKFQSVSPATFAQIIADTTVIRLDVRTPEEYEQGHIDNALNINILSDDFDKTVSATLPKDKTIALYCRSGHRSKKAARHLASKGYKVVELNTGYIGWEKYRH